MTKMLKNSILFQCLNTFGAHCSLEWRLMWGNIIKKKFMRNLCHFLGIALELACNGGSCRKISLKRDQCHIFGIGGELALKRD